MQILHQCIFAFDIVAGGNVTEHQKQRMYELQKNLKSKEQIAVEAVKRATEAEQHALDRDKQLTELLSRMRQYETVNSLCFLIWGPIIKVECMFRRNLD